MDAPDPRHLAAAICNLRTLSHFFRTPALRAWALRAGLDRTIEDLYKRLTETSNFLVVSEKAKTLGMVRWVYDGLGLRRLAREAEGLLDDMDFHRLLEEAPVVDPQLVSARALSLSSSDALQLPGGFFERNLDISQSIPPGVHGIAELAQQYFVGIDGITRSTSESSSSRAAYESATRKSDDDLYGRTRLFIKSSLEIVGALPWHLDAGQLWLFNCISWEVECTACPDNATISVLVGRDAEMHRMLELLTKGFSSRDLSALALVGAGGIGKTALARHIYEHERVADHFNLRRWISLPFAFDAVHIAREMLDCIANNRYDRIENLDTLLHILKDHLKSRDPRRLLLVLDDVREDGPEHMWHKLLAPFKYNMETKGNVILTTTRSAAVAKVFGTQALIQLPPLEEEVFWDFFKCCVYEGEARAHGKDEEIIARQIADKLDGIPLLAKVGAALLKKSSDLMLWRTVLESIDLKRSQAIHSLPVILHLSYACLPFPVQQCFAYCSLFPRDYKFGREDLVYLWMAQGFLNTPFNTKSVEEEGNDYINTLINFAFLEKIDSLGKTYYHMPGLIYDLAKTASSHECLSLIDDLPNGRVLETARHISVIGGLIYKWDEHNKRLLCNENFEEILGKVMLALKDTSLRTFILTSQYYPSSLTISKRVGLNLYVLGRLLVRSSLRVLWLSTMFIDFDLLIRKIDKLNHLRYLKLESDENDRSLPKCLWQLHHLLVLDINGWRGLTSLPEGMTNLVNLRHFVAEKRLHSKIAEVGKLTSLQELQEFRVARLNGFEIAQLGSLKELGGLLSIRGLENVENREEACKAGLVDKERLREMHLSWAATKSTRANSTPTAEADVLEGLQPHNNLKELLITGYGGDTSPEWLEINLPLRSLVSLHLEDCRAWVVLPPLGELPFLKKLKLIRMPVVKEVGVEFYGSNEMEGFKSLEELEFSKMAGLEKWVVIENCQIFPCLKSLAITDCPKLMEFPFARSSSKTVSKCVFPQLRTITIEDCPPHLMRSFMYKP